MGLQGHTQRGGAPGAGGPSASPRPSSTSRQHRTHADTHGLRCGAPCGGNCSLHTPPCPLTPRPPRPSSLGGCPVPAGRAGWLRRCGCHGDSRSHLCSRSPANACLLGGTEPCHRWRENCFKTWTLNIVPLAYLQSRHIIRYTVFHTLLAPSPRRTWDVACVLNSVPLVHFTGSG